LEVILQNFWHRNIYFKDWMINTGKYVVLMMGTAVILYALLYFLPVSAGGGGYLSAAVANSQTSIPYQGRLANSSGNPITGSRTFTFALFGSPTGSDMLWPGGTPEAHTVDVVDGLFNVMLGSGSGNGIPTSILGGDLWLQITVNGETLTPREQIGMVPYAGMAQTVPDGALGSRHVRLTNGHISTRALGTNMVLTGNWVDVPGTTIVLAPETDQTYIVFATVDIEATQGTGVGRLLVDGVEQAPAIIFRGADGYERGTASQSFLLNLSQGSHTIKLQVSGDGGRLYNNNTITYFAVSQ